jgi:four helix bundle protein
MKKVVGDQFISAIDSIGANIAEGWGRFHFLDRNRFNYNARGSLLESIHWLELLHERSFVSEEKYKNLRNKFGILHFKLNNYINATKKRATSKTAK